MPAFVTNPIAYGVRSETYDKKGGPIGEELVAGANVILTPVEVPVGSGDWKIRISSTGGASNTYVSAGNPTPQNDSVDTAGVGRVFEVGDYWFNSVTDKLYLCQDDTPNAAIWAVVDTTEYKQSNIVDNTTTDLNMGAIAQVLGKYLNYRILNAFTGRARIGRIYIGHNGTTAELRDEFVEIGSALNITAMALIDTGNLTLRFTQGLIGGDSVFRYTEELLA
jgi:hypothetical protein